MCIYKVSMFICIIIIHNKLIYDYILGIGKINLYKYINNLTIDP